MSNPFEFPGPRWFTIAPHRPFAEDLARGLFQALYPHGPEALSDAIVLIPTRRGARSLGQAFVKAAGGKPVLLPQIRAIGDLEAGEPPFDPGALALDIPPAATPLQRRFELARLVSVHGLGRPHGVAALEALEMADALSALIDSLYIEERFDADAVLSLGGEEHAAHWRLSAEVLRAAVVAWPDRLAEMGLIDPTDRRVRLTRRLAQSWSDRPPEVPLVVAGATGSAPAQVALIAAAARAPKGLAVLPGLDHELAETVWNQVDEAHPQSAMRRLLDASGVTRAQVRPWPGAPAEASTEHRGRSRRRLINEALRPAEATADWLEQLRTLQAESPDAIDEGLQGLTLLIAPAEEPAAAAIAVLMRETLQTPGRTCALVTPDQTLARRVSARLTRWGVVADGSAGAPLASFPAGVLAGLVARLAADPADPTALLAVAKHPHTLMGILREQHDADLEQLDRWVLRGPRRPDWAGLFDRIETLRGDARDRNPPDLHKLAKLDAAERLASRLHSALSPLFAAFDGPLALPEAARRTTEALEALAIDADGRAGALWAGPDGEALARLMSSLMEQGDALPAVNADDYVAILQRLLESETVRARAEPHPRLQILGLIEARMVSADRLILAGLEEGTWPAPAATDPFLSRPMRKMLGLPAPERAIGQAAHDFTQGACAPEVVLVACERRDGQPAVRSRWIWRLETLVRGAGAPKISADETASGCAALLDAPDSEPVATLLPAVRPEPRPPAKARPKRLFVTHVETLVRDPYAVYARHILNLRQLQRPDEPVDARIRGTAIHAAVEAFAHAWPDLEPQRREAMFRDAYMGALKAAGAPDGALARERPLAERAAIFAVEFESSRRAGPVDVLIEHQIEVRLDDLDFTLAARADRIEIADGRAHVIDFKSGSPPSLKQVRLGFASQLPLTAAMLARGGLDGRAAQPGEFLYVRITGRDPAGQVEPRGLPGQVLGRETAPSEDQADAAWEGLKELVRRFDDEAFPYASRVRPEFITYASDYDHLARVREWSVADDESGGEA